MNNSYGRYYSNAHKGRREIKTTYAVKKVRTGWLVLEVHSREMFMVFPTKLRAYYAATRMNGVDVSTVFNFGSGMFQK